jgi:hypothetical protein
MGECLDLNETSVPVTRKRVILMDLFEKRSLIPRTKEEEDVMVGKYLSDLAIFRKNPEVWKEWGGSPELLAFAHLTKCLVRIYSKNKEGISVVQEFKCPASDNSIILNLLHEGRAHYSTLVSGIEQESVKQNILKHI